MDTLIRWLEKLNIDYDEVKIKQFENYMHGVLNYNESVNLTSITEENEFIIKHYVDSILCNNFNEFLEAKNVIDVGTGAGFPGVPLAIVNENKNFLLIDSLNKRIKIIEQLCRENEINNVTALHGRAEDFAQDKKFREKYDVCVSRAVANLSVLCEYTLPFIKVGGCLLAYKGPDVNRELSCAERAIKVLGGEFDRVQTVELDGYSHNIVIIKKKKNTSAKYPRKSGTPTKMPI